MNVLHFVRVATLVTFLLVLHVSGCGGGKTGTVSGRVTFKGKPLQDGMVSFVTQDGKVATGRIHNGEYLVPNVPVGPARLTVRLIVENALATNQPEDLPPRYRSADASGLRYEVVPGKQTHDFELKAK